MYVAGPVNYMQRASAPPRPAAGEMVLVPGPVARLAQMVVWTRGLDVPAGGMSVCTCRRGANNGHLGKRGGAGGGRSMVVRCCEYGTVCGPATAGFYTRVPTSSTQKCTVVLSKCE